MAQVIGIVLLIMFVLWIISIAWPLLVALAVLGLIAVIVVFLLMKRYFSSPEFLAVKEEISSVVSEHNEISDYVREIRDTGQFVIGESSTGAHAHLATSSNTSKFNYKRDRNVAEHSSKFVHNGSLQVVRKAKEEPIKYFTKYFGVEATEERLSEIESLGESVSRLENAVENLQARENSITEVVSPPWYILKFFKSRFEKEVGLSIPPLEIPYSTYKFQYVSAGGNSSEETSIKLDTPTIDAIIEFLSAKIKFKKSAAGQRSLMTKKFREFIKSRDDFTCQTCSLSTRDEEHLLLEVDHIQPVSKGGLSVESNLQTLCWKCNRSKSNK